eukprot:403370974
MIVNCIQIGKNCASKKYDTKEQLIADIGAELDAIDFANLTAITLSGNSYGREACDYIASLIADHETPLLTHVDFNDLFVGRKLDELPGSLEVLVRSLMTKKIVYLDMSNNAFGPAGIKSFDFLLKEMASLKVLKVTNCGLGPEGGEMIANALKENLDLKLVQFSAGRDRLENKGITALASVFKEMKSLEVIEVPQNGIKKDGMLALLTALKENAETLKEIHVHDNWVKGEAADRLAELIYKAKTLQKLNISDSDMGTNAAYLVIRALHDSSAVRESLTEFYCNFNEITSANINKQVLEMLLRDFPNLKYVEYRGNTLGRKIKHEFVGKYAEQAGRKVVLFEEEEDEEDEEGEDYDDEEEDFQEEDIIKKLEGLKI